jgi:hypothetical protein
MMPAGVRFWPGPGTGIHDQHLTLVADIPPGEDLSLRLLELVSRRGSVEEIVDAFFGGGVWSAPDFALAAVEAEQVRVVVRGGGYVVCGTARVDATGPFTDVTLPLCTPLQVGLRGALPGAGLPSSGGIVPAVAWRLEADGSPRPRTAAAVADEIRQSDHLPSAGAVPATREVPAGGRTTADEVPPAGRGSPESTAAPSPRPVPVNRQTVPPPPPTGPDPQTGPPGGPAGAGGPADAGDADGPDLLVYRRLLSRPRGAEPVTATPAATADPPVDLAGRPPVSTAPVPAPWRSLPVRGPVPAQPAVNAAPPDPPVRAGFIDSFTFDLDDDPDAGPATAVLGVDPTHPWSPTRQPEPRAWQPDGSGSGPSPATGETPGSSGAGRTVPRANLNQTHIATQLVKAVRCPQDHLTPADARHCRVCHEPVPRQEPFELPRPVLGRLVLPTGDSYLLDRSIVMGRDPRLASDHQGHRPHLVRIVDPRCEVSGQHALIVVDGWSVSVIDLGSTNGTEVIQPDGRRERLVPKTPLPLDPGARIVLAEIVEIRFEAIP